MTRPALVATALAIGLAVLPATATPPADPAPGLTPGFWIFPDAPGLDAAALAELCAAGLSLVQADGSRISLWVQDGRLVVDGESVCTRDGAVETCAVHDYQPGRPVVAFTSTGRDGLDAEGRLMLHSASDTHLGREGFVSGRRSYPQMCPADGVRDLFVGWLAPHPAE